LQNLTLVFSIIGLLLAASATVSTYVASGRRFGRTIPVALLPLILMTGIGVTAVATLPLSAGSGSLGRLGGAVVLAGIAAMVLIETAKQVLPLRGAYQRRQIALWLEERGGDPDMMAMGQLVVAMDLVSRPEMDSLRNRESQGDEPQSPELRIRVGSRSIAIGRWFGPARRRSLFFGRGVGGPFNLPAEQLTAQVAAAAERALQQPRGYDALIDALHPGARQRKRLDGEGMADLHREERAELAYGVASAVDQLQIRLTGRWRQYVRVTAVWLAGLCALVFALVVRTPGLHSATFVLAALAFGGFFAWLARDVCAAIERLRR
jgi:hypothetical protein